MNIRKFSKDKLIALHKWNQRSWLIISIITSTVSIWFSLILTFFGQDLNLIIILDNKRTFTALGITLTFIVIAFSVLLALAQKCYEYEELNGNKDKMELEILQLLSATTNGMCDNKYTTLLEKVHDIKKNNTEVASYCLSSPKGQLKEIIKCLNELLCRSLSYKDYKINPNEMYVCLHYNFPEESEEWYLAESVYPQRSISTTELLSNRSTLKQILDSREDLIFWNSKEDARRQNKYIPDEEDQYDEENNLKGSIACYKIQIIFQDKTYINAIVSFVTYSKKFVNKNDRKSIDNVKYNIKENILSVLKKRINVELCLLYLSNLSQNQQQQCKLENANISVVK